MGPEIAHEGVIQAATFLGEGSKGEDGITAYTQDLGIVVREPLEVCVVRGQLRLSDRGEGHHEER